MAERRTHPRNQSQLYKIMNPAQLADKLGIKHKQLNQLLKADDNYIRWVDEKTSRLIQQPKPLLDVVHKRVGLLLSRIETPDFLHSAIKGRSYVSNASQHASNQPTAKIDIRKFYPSIRAQAVFHFFRDRMKCAEHVAGMLTQLLTADGHLATGSSASPILSYFAYEDMFSEIEMLAVSRECKMTCYIDDMASTGKGATRRLIYGMNKILARYRLLGHKTKLFKARQPKVITGVAIVSDGIRLPNKRQKIIRQDLALLDSAGNDSCRLEINRRLVGRLFEAAQIDPRWLPRAELILAQKRGLDQRLS